MNSLIPWVSVNIAWLKTFMFHRGVSTRLFMGNDLFPRTPLFGSGDFFGVSPQFWMNLQSRFELEIEEERLASRLAREVRAFVPPLAA